MNYLIDANIIIDFFKKREPGFSEFSKIESQNLSTSIVCWSEVGYGINKSGNPSKRQQEFDRFLSNFNIKVLSIGIKTAAQFVNLKIGLEKRGLRLEDFDLLIAAGAIAHDLTLVTGNKKHFSRIPGLKLL